MSTLFRTTERLAFARGSMLVVTIVFMAVFVTLMGSLMGYLAIQYRWVEVQTDKERALQIAEAGIEYYRWRLSHFPDDITDGTGGPGSYEHVYEDPELGRIGVFSLEVGGEVLCGEVQVVQATSTGWTDANPDIKRTIVARIARPTVADYSYVVDSPVYAGSSRTIVGPYHGNDFVRMDGNNLSAVTSKITSAQCNPLLGDCSGLTPGVYGDGLHPEWWKSGVAEIPFINFNYTFDAIETKAQSMGLHYPKISNDTTGPYGYYLELQGDSTVDVYRVTNVSWVTSSTSAQRLSFPELLGPLPYSQSGLNTKRVPIALDVPIPADCPLIYVSDRTWLEGTVSGKVTVVANDTTGAAPDLFLQDNITYVSGGDTDGLTVLAEGNLIIPLYVPSVMTINGVFFAQTGAYSKNYYGCTGCTSVSNIGGVNYNTIRLRNTLTTNGTIISKLRTGTGWGSPAVQGFTTRNDNYDRFLAKSPPPRTPYTSQNFRFIEWREVE